jgi:hypothetical protein
MSQKDQIRLLAVRFNEKLMELGYRDFVEKTEKEVSKLVVESRKKGDKNELI